MRNVLLVAKREYLEQVRGRAFKMTTFGVPLIFAAVLGVAFLSSRGLGSGKHLAVASSDALLANEIKGQLVGEKDTKTKVDVISPASSADRDALIDEVRTKKIEGFLWIETPQGKAPVATYTSQSSGDTYKAAQAMAARLLAAGYPAADIRTFDPKILHPLIRAAAQAYPDEQYRKLVEKLPPIVDSDLDQLVGTRLIPDRDARK